MMSRARVLASSVRPELLIVFSLFAVIGSLDQIGIRQTTFLNGFYLPVVLAAYFFGQTRAVITSTASVLLVIWFALSIPGSFEINATSALDKWLGITLWGSLLTLIAAAMGHLYDVKSEAFHELQRAYKGIVEIMSKFIDTADKYTQAHSVRVSLYASAIGRRMGLGDREVEDIRVAALLHDIGKIDVSLDVLKKVGGLKPEEWRQIRQHTSHGALMVDRMGGLLRTAVPLIMHHHERMDGTGYHGLEGEDIPLGARIITVADSFDAMTTDRPYRRALDKQIACGILQEGAGTQFDEDVVVAFLTALNDPAEGLHNVLQPSQPRGGRPRLRGTVGRARPKPRPASSWQVGRHQRGHQLVRRAEAARADGPVAPSVGANETRRYLSRCSTSATSAASSSNASCCSGRDGLSAYWGTGSCAER